jgi:mevalonate kinase
MVESVARQKDRQPDLVRKTFEGITAVSRNARLAIEAGDVSALGKLMDMNQMLLAGLLLSTQEIEAMVQRARSSGALGAKLSRASAEEILAAWESDGYTGFVTEVGKREPRVKLAMGAA